MNEDNFEHDEILSETLKDLHKIALEDSSQSQPMEWNQMENKKAIVLTQGNIRTNRFKYISAAASIVVIATIGSLLFFALNNDSSNSGVISTAEKNKKKNINQTTTTSPQTVPNDTSVTTVEGQKTTTTTVKPIGSITTTSKTSQPQSTAPSVTTIPTTTSPEYSQIAIQTSGNFSYCTSPGGTPTVTNIQWNTMTLGATKLLTWTVNGDTMQLQTYADSRAPRGMYVINSGGSFPDNPPYVNDRYVQYGTITTTICTPAAKLIVNSNSTGYEITMTEY
jgi:hypothetical protein